jgi:integrase
MMTYCTNLRNCELERIQVQDIIKIGTHNFIDIADPSRTKNTNSVRVVPLHPVAYEALQSYIRKNKLLKTDYIFSKEGRINQSVVYRRAYQLLGKKLGYTVEKMQEENISFYSGRHYWKTLMNANGLGEAEEFFMGHKVSSDMAKLYNHRDKQGQKMLLKRAREVFSILDKTLFKV